MILEAIDIRKGYTSDEVHPFVVLIVFFKKNYKIRTGAGAAY